VTTVSNDRPLTLTRRDALLLTIGTVAATAVRAAPSTAASPWVSIDRMCEQLIADHVTPGLTLSVMRDGALIYSHGFGYANLETATKATPQTVFRIGSITKQFTGTAIALLAEDGVLSFDDKLARFMPLFPRAGDITLRQMLTHTSGLGNYTEMSSPEAFRQAARIDYDNAALIAAMDATKPLYKSEPGTAWAYSNTAYVLLGLVVEIAGKEPYGQFLKRRVFDPAGLTHTAVDDAAEVVPNRASGYSPGTKADVAFDNTSFISMTFPHGAGAIRSTSEDLCRWHAALLGGRVLKAATLEQMLTPMRLANGTIPESPAGMALVQGGEHKPMEYGFGIALGDFEGHRYVEHNGGINGFLSALRSFRAERVTVAMLANTDGYKKPELAKNLFEIRDAAVRNGLSRG
jgi:D-alanyl-D-alanine carboxypeptidase